MSETYSSKVFLTLVIFLIPFIGQSQQNYLPGKVLTLKGDTIEGFINYRNWKNNPKNILFKKTLDQSDSERFGINEIKSFFVKDEHYVNAIVEKEISSIRTDQLSYFKEFKIEVDTVFLQTLIVSDSTQKGLYYLRDNAKNHFYIKNGYEYGLLYYKKYLKDINDKTLSTENNRYLSQLALYFKDCPESVDALKNVIYEKNSLKTLFGIYFSCLGVNDTFNKKIEETLSEISIIGGLSATQINFAPKTFYARMFSYLEEFNDDVSTNFTFGLNHNLYFSRRLKKWSLNSDLLYYNFNFRNEGEELQAGLAKTEIKFGYLKVNNLIRYYFRQAKIDVFSNIGVSYSFKVHEKNSRQLTQSGQVSQLNQAVPMIKNDELGFIAGAGIGLGKFSTELRYERGDGINFSSDLFSDTNKFFLLISYRIL